MLHDASNLAVGKAETFADFFEEALRKFEGVVLQVATEKLGNFRVADIFGNICGEMYRFVGICEDLGTAHSDGIALVVGDGPGAKALILAILVVRGSKSLVEVRKLVDTGILGIAESPSDDVGTLSGKLDGREFELLTADVVDEGVTDVCLLADDDFVILENEKFGFFSGEHVVILRVVAFRQQYRGANGFTCV